MGKRDRERKARIEAGLEKPIAREVSGADRKHMHKAGYNALQAMSTGNQIKVLRDSLHLGRLSPEKLRRALEDNTFKEMKKGADKLRKKNKPVTVDALLEEYRKDIGFKGLAAEVGLDEAWFVALAEKEC